MATYRKVPPCVINQSVKLGDTGHGTHRYQHRNAGPISFAVDADQRKKGVREQGPHRGRGTEHRNVFSALGPRQRGREKRCCESEDSWRWGTTQGCQQCGVILELKVPLCTSSAKKTTRDNDLSTGEIAEDPRAKPSASACIIRPSVNGYASTSEP